MREKIRNRFFYSKPKGVVFDPNDKKSVSKTSQSAKDDVDINKIMKKAKKNGLIIDPNNLNLRKPLYGDYSAFSFHEAQMKIAALNSEFDKLNPSTKRLFHHDPIELVEFLADPKNEEKAVELGLMKKLEPVLPVKPSTPTATGENKIEGQPTS